MLIDVGGDLGLADAAPEHQTQASADVLLVEPHAREQRVGIRRRRRDRQAETRQQPREPFGIRGRRAARARRQHRREHHADRDRFAVQQLAVAALGFERVAERVSEIEQRALAGLALVARDDAGLVAAAESDRFGERVGVVRVQRIDVRFEPVEEIAHRRSRRT